MWNTIIFSEVGISRRINYESEYIIDYLEKFDKYMFQIHTNYFEEDYEVLDNISISQQNINIQNAISLIEGYKHIPEK